MSSSSKKISLLSAIFINLNVMIGTGIFINTYRFAATSGAAGFFLYPLVGLCMLPLIAVTGQLLSHYPTGGLYAFAKDYSPYLGFLSCWSYFFGKLASACVMLTVATTMFQQIFPALKSTNPILMSLGILSFFTLLNLQNMRVGLIVQTFFLTSKSIPILFTIVAGILLFDTSAITTDAFIWQGLALNIPFVLYCLAGFETASSLSRNIENPTVNGPKAVYYSFGIIMALYGIFQGFIYMCTYDVFTTITSFDGVFPTICHKIFSSELIANKVSILLSFAIGSSALGGAYGILFANSWNLYTIAEHGHTIAKSTITKLNKHQTPWVAVLTESLTCTMFLLFNQGSIVPLQRTATLGIVIAYTISTFAYFKLLGRKQKSFTQRFITYAAFITCLLFVSTCATSFLETGIAPLMLFITILVIGSGMYLYTNQEKIGSSIFK
ncbi:APC family permease [Candidatus Babeliales bacterium]|nr:APC family permease [Candidatus Babeliales bacterium]MBP9843342.1 APC family permease [Candidatus Babeliales bacterium]